MKSKLIILLLIFTMLVIYFGLNFAPGSYVNTPKYEFNISEKKLIEKISKLKEIDTTLIVPKKFNLIEGRKDINDHWYHFFIYYPKEQQIVNCWVREKTSSSSIIAFVSIKDKNGKWNVIENNNNLKEVQKLKLIFEERFVNRLKEMKN